jgi:hypothetical protein
MLPHTSMPLDVKHLYLTPAMSWSIRQLRELQGRELCCYRCVRSTVLLVLSDDFHCRSRLRIHSLSSHIFTSVSVQHLREEP